ncbi:Activating molecule in BECN1-regulated autophagy protein 1 [Orchesella cincta]|uniref:Activating molecule in BECN1-regulated autophagy protein 1 n=1 Tax=Orchesella cincta TaxID=48709 RepID=A0A1D2N3Y5_ORCCI|nr:Activating molecule in BECN1-regulated autophagy protein 1 [Orchesella cincta]
MRLEEIQMRISVLSQWSRARAMATSGTQTPQSFVRGTWPSSERLQQNGSNTDRERAGNEQLQVANAPTPSSSSSINSAGGGSSSSADPRFSRRRPYSRIARLVRNDIEDISDDEVLVSVPTRMSRLSDPSSMEQERARTERSDIPNREAGRGGSIRHHFDHWVLRSNPSNPVVHRYRPSAVLELAGSARTRAPPVNRYSGDNAEHAPVELPSGGGGESTRPRLHFPRGGSSRAAAGPVGGGHSNDGNNNNVGNGNEDQHADGAARFYPGYIPEILITPRTRPPTYFTMDAATTAFLSSRIQKWDFSEFLIPDITKRDEFVVVRECSLHSDACLDVSADSEFLAVLQPSDNGSYSSVGIYSLRDESLGVVLNVYHFDQNTVSVSISPSCDYMIVAYAGRGPLYRFVHPSRNIGKILSLTRDDEGLKLVPVKDLYADGQVAFMSINCMHWVPVAGYGIIYGTNTGDLVLLS